MAIFSHHMIATRSFPTLLHCALLEDSSRRCSPAPARISSSVRKRGLSLNPAERPGGYRRVEFGGAAQAHFLAVFFARAMASEPPVEPLPVHLVTGLTRVERRSWQHHGGIRDRLLGGLVRQKYTIDAMREEQMQPARGGYSQSCAGFRKLLLCDGIPVCLANSPEEQCTKVPWKNAWWWRCPKVDPIQILYARKRRRQQGIRPSALKTALAGSVVTT